MANPKCQDPSSTEPESELRAKGIEFTKAEASREERSEKKKMGAITSAVIAIVAVVLGYITIEIACKPCLEQGRAAIDRNLNPDYDPDDEVVVSSDIRAPLNPQPTNTIDVEAEDPKAAAISASYSGAVKSV